MYLMNVTGCPPRNCSILFGLDPEGGCAKDTYDRTQVFAQSTIPKFAYQLKTNYQNK